MKDLRQNAEGYFDPTPYQAVLKAPHFGFHPVVYIASAYAGDVETNTEKARKYARFAVDEGCIPIVPHLLFPQFMDEKTERDKALFFARIVMDRCLEVWVFGAPTHGMRLEIARAKKHRKLIRYFTESLEEVLDNDNVSSLHVKQ